MKPYIHTVQYYETDKMAVTHHSNYIRIMEEARIDFLSQIGWNYDRLEKQGMISPVVSVSCEFRQPSRFADKIAVTVRIEKLTSARMVLCYTMRLDGAVICTARSTHCFVSPEGKPVSVRRNYPEFFEALCRAAEGEPRENVTESFI